MNIMLAEENTIQFANDQVFKADADYKINKFLEKNLVIGNWVN